MKPNTVKSIQLLTEETHFNLTTLRNSLHSKMKSATRNATLLSQFPPIFIQTCQANQEAPPGEGMILPTPSGCDSSRGITYTL